MTHSPPRLVLVGGGHAMLPTLAAARAWVGDGTKIYLISDCRYLYYSGMVPEFLGGVYTEDEVRIDLEALCVRSGITFIEDAAVGIDCTARTISTAEGLCFTYDLAAFDIGARNPGSPPEAILTKPLHAVAALAHRLHALDREPPARPFRLVIAGGGAAGVEVALNLSTRFDASRLAISIVEPATRLLASFPEGMSAYAATLLEQREVTTYVHDQVIDIRDGHAVLDKGPALPADEVLWATGSAGPPLFRKAGLPCDPRGFLRVNAALQCLATPRLFAAGDCAAVQGYEHLARVGVHAVKQGPTLRANLYRSLLHLRQNMVPEADALEAFRPYPTAPLILSTGAPEAIWTAGSVWIHSKTMLRLKHLLDQRWMRRYHDLWNDVPLWRMPNAAAAAS